MPPQKQKEDPIEKLGKMIDEKITQAFESRDRASREEKDPWAKIEGIVDRAVSRHFENFAKGLEEGERRERSSGGGGKNDEDQGEGRDFLSVVGLR